MVTMKKQLLTFIVAAALTGACGGKSKKADTTPTVPVAVEDPVVKPEPSGLDPAEEPEAPDPQLVEKILFEFDSAILDESARRVLDNNAEWLKGNPEASITIEGHTDEQGTGEYNLALGDRRARAARDYLVSLGIDKRRITIISYGEERPAVQGDDAQNRRSMFVRTK
jgi:peptidoglycan-associated lipoprotein